MVQANDADITAALIADAESGFRSLMAKYKSPVYWHIRRLVVTHADAQDATQETFVRVYRAIGRLKDVKSLRAWIYRLATNEALRILSRRREEQLTTDDTLQAADRLTADEYVDYTDVEAVRLQKAILSLPAKQQVTFNLRYYDELGYDEIAAITDSTAAGAKANYHAAKERIIKFMNSSD